VNCNSKFFLFGTIHFDQLLLELKTLVQDSPVAEIKDVVKYLVTKNYSDLDKLFFKKV
jgi:hypothetical protein